VNVLVRGDGTACLADFGLSLMYSEVVSISKAAWTSSFHGNSPWLAPELLEDTEDGLPVRPSKTSDIYAFGGIMLQVCRRIFHRCNGIASSGFRSSPTKLHIITYRSESSFFPYALGSSPPDRVILQFPMSIGISLSNVGQLRHRIVRRRRVL
jgi:serine/threonine protein kinase